MSLPAGGQRGGWLQLSSVPSCTAALLTENTCLAPAKAIFTASSLKALIRLIALQVEAEGGQWRGGRASGLQLERAHRQEMRTQGQRKRRWEKGGLEGGEGTATNTQEKINKGDSGPPLPCPRKMPLNMFQLKLTSAEPMTGGVWRCSEGHSGFRTL